MKKRFGLLTLILPLTLAASTGWWFLFSPGRISKEVWTNKDEVFCGAVFSPLDTTDTLGRADQRWPGQWNQMINCSTYFRNCHISGKFYLDDSLEEDNITVFAKSRQRHDEHPAFGTAGWAICDAGNSNSSYGAWGFGTNSGSGPAYGGWFQGAGAGTGTHYGVYCESDSFGIYAKTTAPGTKYAGYFEGSVLITDTTFHSFYKPVRAQYYEGWADTHKIHADSLWELYSAYINQGNVSTNTVTGFQAAVLSGTSNTASGDSSVVPGGRYNRAIGRFSTVGGGEDNVASGTGTTVVGGQRNNSSGNNSVSGGFLSGASGVCAVAFGGVNYATTTYATVSGGSNNSSSSQGATIGGGENNKASGQGATIGGGINDSAAGNYSTVAGGGYCDAISIYSTVGGGWNNSARSTGATVAGGSVNTAPGYYSFIPGGYACTTSTAYDGACGYHSVTLGGASDGAQFAVGHGSLCDSTYNSGAAGGVTVDTDSTWGMQRAQIGTGTVIAKIVKVGSFLAIISIDADTFWCCTDTTQCP